MREVLDEHWSAAPAALRLSVLVGNDLGLLCHLRARLRRAAARRQSELTRRALATLDVVLASPRASTNTPSAVTAAPARTSSTSTWRQAGLAADGGRQLGAGRGGQRVPRAISR